MPAPLATVLWVLPVSSEVMVTWALATTAPEGSETMPVISPLCALATRENRGVRKIRNANRSGKRPLRRRDWHCPAKGMKRCSFFIKDVLFGLSRWMIRGSRECDLLTTREGGTVNRGDHRDEGRDCLGVFWYDTGG